MGITNGVNEITGGAGPRYRTLSQGGLKRSGDTDHHSKELSTVTGYPYPANESQELPGNRRGLTPYGRRGALPTRSGHQKAQELRPQGLSPCCAAEYLFTPLSFDGWHKCDECGQIWKAEETIKVETLPVNTPVVDEEWE